MASMLRKLRNLAKWRSIVDWALKFCGFSYFSRSTFSINMFLWIGITSAPMAVPCSLLTITTASKRRTLGFKFNQHQCMQELTWYVVFVLFILHLQFIIAVFHSLIMIDIVKHHPQFGRIQSDDRFLTFSSLSRRSLFSQGSQGLKVQKLVEIFRQVNCI